jgi:LysW-gamma-L-alpha-aminoadipyl-6-phosphate/LysW-L-glutamyl-5-phosphate reductase
MKKFNVAILGGSGFVGAELYRILCSHPIFNIQFVSSESNADKFVERTYKLFRYQQSNPTLKFSSLESLEAGYDIIFSALPTGVLPLHINTILPKTQRLINVSGDFRFSDEKILERYYPNSLGVIKDDSTVNYFIPELSKVNDSAKIINLPGCMAVASIYSIYPLIKNQLIEEEIIIEAKTGSSGAGKSSKETHAERTNNYRLHKAFSHRHLPEIQSLNMNHKIQFSAFSLDVSRGIYVSAYSHLK